MIDIISLFIAIVSLIISVIVAIRQLNIARQTIALEVFVDMFREFRDPEFKEHLEYIYQNLKNYQHDLGYSNLPTEAKLHVKTVSHFFNNIAFLVTNKIIDEKYIIGYMGRNIEQAWEVLRPFLEEERKNRSYDEYQAHFEHLVCLMREKPQEKFIKEEDLKKIIPRKLKK